MVYTGVSPVPVRPRPRLPSDNGPCYLSSQLKDCLDTQQRTQPCGAAYYPMVQGKRERYPRVHEECGEV